MTLSRNLAGASISGIKMVLNKNILNSVGEGGGRQLDDNA